MKQIRAKPQSVLKSSTEAKAPAKRRVVTFALDRQQVADVPVASPRVQAPMHKEAMRTFTSPARHTERVNRKASPRTSRAVEEDDEEAEVAGGDVHLKKALAVRLFSFSRKRMTHGP